MLTVRDLRFAHLGPISLAVDPAECVGIVGPSGAGKTLFLRAICDLDPNEGEVELAGKPARECAPPDWRRRVGYLPTESQWWTDRVKEHFFASPPVESLADFGFSADVLEWPVSRLSSGERQRLAFLRLLAIRPECLLLDEPTAHLDNANAIRLEAMAMTYRRENRAPVLWVSHDPAVLERNADRVLRLQDNLLVSEADG